MKCPSCMHNFGEKKYKPFGVPEIQCHKCHSVIPTKDRLLSQSSPLMQKLKFFIYAMNYSRKEFMGDTFISNILRNWMFLLLFILMFFAGIFSSEIESTGWRLAFCLFTIGLSLFYFQEFPGRIKKQKRSIEKIEEAYHSSRIDNEYISSLIYFK